jgi:hypothetical protein
MASQPENQIPITLKLRRGTSDKLRQRAAASGKDVGEFVSELVEHFAEPPTPLETLSGPIYQRFLESGMTDEQLGEELERAKDEMRSERRSRNAS